MIDRHGKVACGHRRDQRRTTSCVCLAAFAARVARSDRIHRSAKQQQHAEQDDGRRDALGCIHERPLDRGCGAHARAAVPRRRDRAIAAALVCGHTDPRIRLVEQRHAAIRKLPIVDAAVDVGAEPSVTRESGLHGRLAAPAHLCSDVSNQHGPLVR